MLQALDRLQVSERRYIDATVPAGPFTPIAEDQEGYYFKAKYAMRGPNSGIDWYRLSETRTSGLYLSKVKPGVVYVYLGDPLSDPIFFSKWSRLTPGQVSLLRLGKIERSGEGSTKKSGATR